MNMTVSLPGELADFVEAKVKVGGYTSSSAVVQEALRLMERVEQRNVEKLRDLRKAWQEGIDSGEAVELDFEALKAEGRARFAASKA